MLSDIRDAEDRAQAVIAIKAFAEAYAAKYPKAVAKIARRQVREGGDSRAPQPAGSGSRRVIRKLVHRS